MATRNNSTANKRKTRKSKPAPVGVISDEEMARASVLLEQIDALADLFITHGMENGNLDEDAEALTLINIIQERAQTALAILDGWSDTILKEARHG